MKYDEKFRESLVEKIVTIIAQESIDPRKAVLQVTEISDALLIAIAFFWSMTDRTKTPRDQRLLTDELSKQLRGYLKESHQQFLEEGITVVQIPDAQALN